MQLSDAQKWALRTLLKYSCHIYIDHFGHARYGGFSHGKMPYVVRRLPPRVSTVTALKDKGLIRRQKLVGFVLTPRGREEARKLEGAA